MFTVHLGRLGNLMDAIKLASLNTRGMRGGLKRRKIFRFLKKHKVDVGFLQETHCVKTDENCWSAEFGNKIIFSNGSSNSCGVAILFSKKCAKLVTDIVRDMEGRFIIAKLKVNEYTYSIANIYAPNGDSPSFFQQVKDEMDNLDSIFNIIGGDFNMIRDANLDRGSEAVYHGRSKTIVDGWMEEDGYSDIWRELHPGLKTFTWMKAGARPSWSRIDYFLVSGNTRSNCNSASIHPSICSDHSLITLDLETSETKRGPGCWKFNDELLNDQSFCANVKQIIEGTKRVYEYMNGTDFWDLLKHEITSYSRDYAKMKSLERKEEKFILYEVLGRMQSELIMDGGWTPDLLKNITEVSHNIEAHETLDAKRSAFRCKQQWIGGGEKMSKYYFNMEKRNFLNKTMYVVKKPDGSLTKDYTEILNLQYEFYSNLFKSDPNVHFNLQNNSTV